MLHAAALADLESGHDGDDNLMAWGYEIIDPDGVDSESIATLKSYEDKVELIFGWVQMTIVDNIKTGVLAIPPPILSRVFQELANGMVAFHNAKKITFIPFPFPYAQTCDCLLMLHWLVVPLVTSQWTTNPLWAGIFCFIQVFILWSLNTIAMEIENPFGTDANDIDGAHMQMTMNRHLYMMVDPRADKIPKLSRNFTARAPNEIQNPRSSTSSFSALLTESRTPSKTSENPNPQGAGKTEDDRSCCFSDFASPREQGSSETSQADRNLKEDLPIASGRPTPISGRGVGETLLCCGELRIEQKEAMGADPEDTGGALRVDGCNGSSNVDFGAGRPAGLQGARMEDIEVGQPPAEDVPRTQIGPAGWRNGRGPQSATDWEEFERGFTPRVQPKFKSMESGADGTLKVPSLRSGRPGRLVNSLPPASLVFDRSSQL